MDKIFISNQIKFDILSVVGMPVSQPYNLMAATPLNQIGYEKDESLCRLLEEKLIKVAEDYKTGRKVAIGDISQELTVRQCIQLVIA